MCLRLALEAEFRRCIDAARIDLFQPLIASDSTPENLLKTPHLALGWADGSPLKWTDTNPAAEHHRKCVMRAIANASLDLLRIQQSGTLYLFFPCLASLTNSALGETALDWITSKIDRKITRARANTLRGGTVAECEEQKQLIPKYWMPVLDDAPHVLVHGDLSGNKVIVVNEPFAVQR
jgi:hypothetical protein